MAGLQELRKRLRSIRATEQLSEAMLSASTAKYARINRIRGRSQAYADACRGLLASVGSAAEEQAPAAARDRDCLVVFGSNRGLCGGYNTELLRFFDAFPAQGSEAPLLIACSRKAAAHFRQKGLAFEEHILSDVPAYEEIHGLYQQLSSLYAQGEARRVILIYQHYINVLRQEPTAFCLFPHLGSREADTPSDTLLFLPDRETVGERLSEMCLDASFTQLILESAAGAQSATMMAMRSACDNARESSARLETTINRRRQAEITASVIETASGSPEQGV